ncbi:FtsK/SpoIIIE domain-containing protein [Mycobacterium sp. DL592]|uniref:FtsK/SpoIIIE domain-containing protein n=1 Tax=Mycobacterium sp. DL592 TaxID=2675524 RepID=UPI001FB89C56|nr:FtsK/SpoIIIE domain-containing protein [Mycobacterium sp. DL592]
MRTTTIEFGGHARLRPPEIPGDDIVIPAPPVPAPTGGPARFAPALVVGVVAGAGMLVWAARSGRPVSPMMLMLPGMALMSMLAMLWQSGRAHGGLRLDEQRRRYLDHLDGLAAQLRDAAQRQHVRLTWMHPAPAALWTLIGGRRMWERRAGERDFGHVRLGLGAQRLCRRIALPPVAAPEDLDPVTAEAFRQCVRTHAVVDDAPIALALTGVSALALDGDRDDARALARAMICQLAVLQPPNAVLIAAMVDPGRRDEWDWLKWLPHNRHPASGTPMVYDCHADLEALAADAVRPHLIVLVDRSDGRYAAGGEAVTSMVVGTAADTDALTMRLDAGRLSVSGEEFARADALSVAAARDCARRLARYRVSRAVDAASDGGALRVPLGRTPDGAAVDLDIKEAAEGGHGPHGLCIGATGSGKSELLRTVVVGMACRHSPDELNLVLVDFKGGATFLGLGGLAHVAAIITNLSEDDQLVMRAKEALAGEIHRRQQLLHRAGNAVNLAAYRLARHHDPQLPLLPSLLVVVDEFAELLHRQPEFADLFAMIGRVGRSLGVHLLLASQRLDEGRLRGLESHLSYRICQTATVPT